LGHREKRVFGGFFVPFRFVFFSFFFFFPCFNLTLATGRWTLSGRELFPRYLAGFRGPQGAPQFPGQVLRILEIPHTARGPPFSLKDTVCWNAKPSFGNWTFCARQHLHREPKSRGCQRRADPLISQPTPTNQNKSPTPVGFVTGAPSPAEFSVPPLSFSLG